MACGALPVKSGSSGNAPGRQAPYRPALMTLRRTRLDCHFHSLQRHICATNRRFRKKRGNNESEHSRRANDRDPATTSPVVLNELKTANGIDTYHDGSSILNSPPCGEAETLRPSRFSKGEEAPESLALYREAAFLSRHAACSRIPASMPLRGFDGETKRDICRGALLMTYCYLAIRGGQGYSGRNKLTTKSVAARGSLRPAWPFAPVQPLAATGGR